MKNETIRDFTDLNAWKWGHDTVLSVYTETKTFPKEELFGLVAQMRRCSVSITSNIAEGFGRNSLKEKHQFYNVAKGSISELQNQLFIARDTGLMTREKFDILYTKTVKTYKLLNGLINSSHMKNHS